MPFSTMRPVVTTNWLAYEAGLRQRGDVTF
jgi:hypothetical protein